MVQLFAPAVGHPRTGQVVLDEGQHLVDGAGNQLHPGVERLPDAGLLPFLLPARKPRGNLESAPPQTVAADRDGDRIGLPPAT